MKWHIITGEYPPQPGGVSDYTGVIANSLAANGDTVHIWAPATDKAEIGNHGVIVHRLPGRFGINALRRLDAELARAAPGKLLVQYVPQAFGWKGMNLPFCMWLCARRKLMPIVMFHEVMHPIERGAPWRHRMLGAVSALMASVVARAAAGIFVSTPIWQEILRTKVKVKKTSEWLPIPSAVPVVMDEARIAAVRQRFGVKDGVIAGHFSSYPADTRRFLSSVVPVFLQAHPGVSLMLIGTCSESYRGELLASAPLLTSRISATGQLSVEDVSLHLSACDTMIQPYPDGACARRTTLVAAIAHGRAVVTNAGPATEPFWKTSGGVALVEEGGLEAMIAVANELIAKPELRRRYGDAAAKLYSDRFELSRAIRMLREVGCGSQ